MTPTEAEICRCCGNDVSWDRHRPECRHGTSPNVARLRALKEAEHARRVLDWNTRMLADGWLPGLDPVGGWRTYPCPECSRPVGVWAKVGEGLGRASCPDCSASYIVEWDADLEPDGTATDRTQLVEYHESLDAPEHTDCGDLGGCPYCGETPPGGSKVCPDCP